MRQQCGTRGRWVLRSTFFCALGLILAANIPAQAAGTNYYVSTSGNDANRGTARTNAWRTIQWAVNHVGPGDCITVLAGTYAGALIQRAGLPSAPITLKADDGASVILNTKNPVGNSSHNSILWLEDWDGYGPVSHWIIQGFEVANSPRYGIDIRGRPGQTNCCITVLSNKVHNSVVTGIFTAFTDDALIQGNQSYSNGEHGVYCSNSGDRPVVRGNWLYRNTGCGLHMNADLSMGGDGIITGGLVENNRIHRNGTAGGAGINMDGVVGTRVQNNLIYAAPNNSGIALFKQNGAVVSQGNAVVNNTVIMNTNVTGSCGWGLTVAAGAVSNRIQNNIFYSYHSFRGAIQLGTAVIPGLVCDYNALESCFSADNGTTTITNMAAWQALGYDTHSVVISPTQTFVNLPGDDYHLQTNSLAIDKGTLPSSLLFDLDGAPRLQGMGVDIGAYEAASPSNWTIVVAATTNGLISPTGFVVVARGGSATFTIQGAPHYHVTGIQTNRGTVGAFAYDNSCTNVTFTWSGVASNGVFSAQFAENLWSGVPETWLVQYYPGVGQSGTNESKQVAPLAPAASDYGSLVMADTDGDGHAAWQEYMTGTDPNDAASVMKITEVTYQSTSNRIQWLGSNKGSAAPFIVSRADNVGLGAVWTNIAVIAKNVAGTNTWWDAGAPSICYYRVSVLAP